MISLWDIFVAPFTEYVFMQKALISCIFLCLSAVPLGVFLLLRGLSLVGDSLSHGILPGIALAAIFFGMNPIALLAISAVDNSKGYYLQEFYCKTLTYYYLMNLSMELMKKLFLI